MRILSFARLVILAFSCFTVFSCSDKTELLQTDQLGDYMPLAVGKYITYRVDSLVFTAFGANTEIHRYQVKHEIESTILDNLGRPSYRVFRYQRDSVGLQPWQASGSYFITPLDDQVEVIEDNLRFIKLHAPIRTSFSWNGNRYLPNDPYKPAGYNFSNDDNMEDWSFYYDNFASSYTHRGNRYDNVYTVEAIDESFNVPITVPTAYGARSRAVEKYAKAIGLVYRHYELWEYQPNTGGPAPFKTGFGITMWMIDHN